MSDMTSDVKQLKIEEFSLVDFVMKIQQGIRDGYEVTDQSDDAPLQIGGGFYTIMREAAKPSITVGKLVMEASIDTTKLQTSVESCLESVGHLNKQLDEILDINEITTADDFLMVSDDIKEELSGVVVDEKLHETSIDPEKDADKWDNKELGADEAYVETIEPPKEPTLDESLPKEEQVVQTKQTTKRGKK